MFSSFSLCNYNVHFELKMAYDKTIIRLSLRGDQIQLICQISLRHSHAAIAMVVIFVITINIPNFLTYRIEEHPLTSVCPVSLFIEWLISPSPRKVVQGYCKNGWQRRLDMETFVVSRDEPQYFLVRYNDRASLLYGGSQVQNPSRINSPKQWKLRNVDSILRFLLSSLRLTHWQSRKSVYVLKGACTLSSGEIRREDARHWKGSW